MFIITKCLRLSLAQQGSTVATSVATSVATFDYPANYHMDKFPYSDSIWEFVHMLICHRHIPI